jgi:hypothetical protein
MTFESPLIYDCLAGVLMTAFDFSHSRLGFTQASHKRAQNRLAG